jgi:hypothetical protein
VCAIDIGIGHHDDFFVAQILFPVFGAGAAAQRLDQIGQFLVLLQFAGAGAGDVQDFASERQDGLGGAVARLLCAAAGGIAFDQENLGSLGGVAGAIRQLAGQAQLAGRGLARNLFLLPLA